MQDIANTQHLHQAKSPGRSDKSHNQAGTFVISSNAYREYPGVTPTDIAMMDEMKAGSPTGACWKRNGRLFKGKFQAETNRSRKRSMFAKGHIFMWTQKNNPRAKSVCVFYDTWRHVLDLLLSKDGPLTEGLSNHEIKDFICKLRAFFGPNGPGLKVEDVNAYYFKDIQEINEGLKSEAPIKPMLPKARLTAPAVAQESSSSKQCAFVLPGNDHRPPPPESTGPYRETTFSEINISLSPTPYGKNFNKDEGSKYQDIEIPKHQMQSKAQIAPEDVRSNIAKELKKRGYHSNFIQALLNTWEGWTEDFRKTRATPVGALLHESKKATFAYSGPIKIPDEFENRNRNRERATQVGKMLTKHQQQFWSVGQKHLSVGGGGFVQEIPYDLDPKAFDDRLVSRLTFEGDPPFKLPSEEPAFQKVSRKEADQQAQTVQPQGSPHRQINKPRAEKIKQICEKAKKEKTALYPVLCSAGFADMDLTEHGVYIRNEEIPFSMPPEDFTRKMRAYLNGTPLKRLPWEPKEGDAPSEVSGVIEEVAASKKLVYENEK